MAQLNTRIVLRNDSLANWESHSLVVLLKGEVGVAFDDNGVARIKIGDGVKTWSELDWFGGNVSDIDGVTQEQIDALQAQIDEITGKLGQPATETTEATGVYKELADIISAVDTKIDAKIDAFANKLTDDGKVNTLLEMIDYVENHGSETQQIITNINTLQQIVGDTPLSEQVTEILKEQEVLTNKELGAIYQRVKYEVVSSPVGTLVNYRDGEVRVMCPADTVWTTQNSGANADAESYYIGFRAYAPEGAVNFKEAIADTITDDTLYSFEGNDFAGTDEHGRKYSVIWLPVAKHDSAADTWSYHGSKSTGDKYVGWYYSVEWYDADGVQMDADCIRINLSNEKCHSNTLPYFMSGVVKTVMLGDDALPISSGSVVIPIATTEKLGVVKGSDSVNVAEDGTLSVATVNIDNLTQDEDTVLILNGGGAA